MVAQATEQWTPEQIASLCDHTYLSRPEQFKGCDGGAVRAYRSDISRFLTEMFAFPVRPYSVCIRPEVVAMVSDALDAAAVSDVVICSVVGFPDGTVPTALKISEARLALEAGAKEIDMVLDYDAYHSGDIAKIERDVCAVVATTHENGGLLKLILEVSELSLEAVADLCRRAAEWGVDMIKTSTGYSSEGATVDSLKVMARNFSGGVKISGGVRAGNVRQLLAAVAEGRGAPLACDPGQVRIGESGLLKELLS